MHPRAAAKLAQLRPPELVEALAEGMGLIAEHVASLEAVAERQEGPAAARAVEVIRVVSDEEAAKFLILLDVARALFTDPSVKAAQLKKSYNHIAKGIYARAVDIRPADFAELLRYAESLRRSHYLDGPNDVDWIFRNEIEAEREEKLYVDYVSTDDGDAWVTPRHYDDAHLLRNPSGAVQLVAAMTRAGFCTQDVLSIVSEAWRDFHPGPETHWSENQELNVATLEQLPPELVDGLSEDDIRGIIQTWMFPLHGVELDKVKVDLLALRQQQLDWNPDGFRLEDFY